jgi:peptidoglycan hydrolase-like protein with peptidoglycan-binding domain
MALALVTLVAAGCSGDDDEGATTTTATATTQPVVRHHELTPEEIAEYQTDLEAVGCWAGPVDGILGPRTEAALREFQEAEGLDVTGLFGGVSQGALTAAAQAGEPVCGDPEPEQAEPVSTDEAAVHELEVWQHDLNVVGCWAGAEDGTLGPQTEAAIRAYQAAAGLAVDGRLGPQTEASLAEAAAAGHQVCAAPASGSGGTAGQATPVEDTSYQVNSGGVYRTRDQADIRLADLQDAGIGSFRVISAAGGFIVIMSGLSEDDAYAILDQMNRAGISGRVVAGV